jgi:hypothetical protein
MSMWLWAHGTTLSPGRFAALSREAAAPKVSR